MGTTKWPNHCDKCGQYIGDVSGHACGAEYATPNASDTFTGSQLVSKAEVLRIVEKVKCSRNVSCGDMGLKAEHRCNNCRAIEEIKAL